MNWKDTQKAFGRISIINHWTLAILMIGMLIFGLILEDMPRADKRELMPLHKSIGILILFLGLWRVGWRIICRFPERLPGLKAWEINAAKVAHSILLIGILLMPLSGYVMSEAGGRSVSFFGLFNMPELPNSKALKDFASNIHDIFGKFLMAIILLHIAAALKHHFVSKDATLKRMLGVKAD